MATLADCEVSGCGKPAKQRGWCWAHYSRWYRYGDPLARPQRTVREEEVKFWKFWNHVRIGDGCWEWTGAHNLDGYSTIRLEDRKTYMAHRLAYEFMRGPLPKGLEADHLCRNRGCVRPDHLEFVTHQENVRRGFVARRRTVV